MTDEIFNFSTDYKKKIEIAQKMKKIGMQKSMCNKRKSQ